VNQVREKLHSAREALNPVLGRRRTTTEAELDECAQVLEELKRAYQHPISAREVDMLSASFDEVIARIKNRPRRGDP
jgi:uncharacterized protein YqgV (UPF0045/DUF77 family)